MWALLIPAAYLLGTFPSAALVARSAGLDIHAAGSGNPGASNVTRTLGWRKGVVVFALDALKGIAATLVGLWVGGRAGGYVLGSAAVVGHIFPITHRFRGGKGIASAGGMLAVLHPGVAVVVFAVWLFVSRAWHQAALASIVAIGVALVGVAVSGRPAWEMVASASLTTLLLTRHAGNIRRMVRREEHPLDRPSTPVP